jgi:hypothetical protein
VRGSSRSLQGRHQLPQSGAVNKKGDKLRYRLCVPIDADRSVPVELVRAMMKQRKKRHANLRYTEYHNVDHDVWNRAFAEPEPVPWLSSRRRENRPKAKLALARVPRIIKIVA